MRPIVSRLCTVMSMAVVFGSCNSDRAVAPDAGLWFVSGASAIAPDNIFATPVSSSQINVSWVDKTTSESGYEVYRTPVGGGTFTLLGTTAPNVSTYSDMAIQSSTLYCYEVRAFRKHGKNTYYTVFSTPSCATTLPASPTNLNAVPATSSAVDVAWTRFSPAATGFRIERAASSQGPWSLAATVPSGAVMFRDAGRTSEVQVCYRVSAVTAEGVSAPSNVDCTIPPAAPTNVTATTPTERTIDLTWTDRSLVEDGYEIRRARGDEFFSVLVTLPANTVSYHDVGVDADATYSYVVRATRDGGGSDFSAVTSAVSAATRPAAPSNVAVIPSSSTSIEIRFNDNSGNESGFRVQRSTDGQQTWQTAFTLAPTGGGPQFTGDFGRQPEQPVCYRLLAFNVKGDSDPSNVSCTTPPAAPTDLTAVTTARQVIDLHWTNHSAVADGYIVQRVYSDYYYYDYTYVTIATLGPGATSYHDTNLGPNDFASYRVLATKDGGQSDPSNVASTSTELPPPAPTGLTARGVASNRIDLAWTEAAGVADAFFIQRCQGAVGTCNDEAFNFVGSVGGADRTYIDLNATSGVVFTYRIRAVRAGAMSAPSNEASASSP